MKRKRRRVAFFFALLTLGCGFVVPTGPALTQQLGVSGSEVSLVRGTLVALGLFLSGYAALWRGRDWRAEGSINLDEVIERLRSFEEHQACQREMRARTLHYDEFRIP